MSRSVGLSGVNIIKFGIESKFSRAKISTTTFQREITSALREMRCIFTRVRLPRRPHDCSPVNLFLFYTLRFFNKTRFNAQDIVSGSSDRNSVWNAITGESTLDLRAYLRSSNFQPSRPASYYNDAPFCSRQTKFQVELWSFVVPSRTLPEIPFFYILSSEPSARPFSQLGGHFAD